MNRPRILMVYANPAIAANPVPPYGAERIATVLRNAGCEVQVIMPFMHFRPRQFLKKALDWQPDIVGFSIRNLDDALIIDNAGSQNEFDTNFFLPPIKKLVDAVKQANIPIILGGCGFSTSPQGILEFLGVRFGISGPADDLMAQVGRSLAAGKSLPESLNFADARIFDLENQQTTVPAIQADIWPLVGDLTTRTSEYLGLARSYTGWGAIVPVQISAGCNRRCYFCVEASFLHKKISQRPIKDVVLEIQQLQDVGATWIFLVASELNVPDAKHCIALLRAIKKANINVQLWGCIQPAPVDDELLDAMEAVGIDPALMLYEFGHLDARLLAKGAGPANKVQIDKLVELYVKRGYPTLMASMILGAHPEENWASINNAIAAAHDIDKQFPMGFQIFHAAGGRIYARSPLGQYVQAHLEESSPYLYGKITPGFVEPLVYSRPAPPKELFMHIRTGLQGMTGVVRAVNFELLNGDALRAEKYVYKAIQLHNEHKESASLTALKQALHIAPNHPSALYHQGIFYAKNQKTIPDAIDTITQLAELVAGQSEYSTASDVAVKMLAGGAIRALRSMGIDSPNFEKFQLM